MLKNAKFPELLPPIEGYDFISPATGTLHAEKEANDHLLDSTVLFNSAFII